MKRFSLFLLFFGVISLNASNLNLIDLELLLSAGNFAKANTILSAKEFYYQKSEEDNSSTCKEIFYQWGNSDNWENSDTWITLSIENNGNGQINRLYLSLLDLSGYSKILSQIENNKYVYLETSTIIEEGNERTIQSVYANSKYILKANVTRIEEDNQSYSIWSIEIFRKESRYDKYNGIKKKLSDNGTICISYKIKNGFLDGRYEHYLGGDGTHPHVIISPDDDKWCYEVYNVQGELIFKGVSPRSEINMMSHKENILVGYGTIYKIENNEWKTTQGKVRIRIIPAMTEGDIITLIVITDSI